MVIGVAVLRLPADPVVAELSGFAPGATWHWAETRIETHPLIGTTDHPTPRRPVTQGSDRSAADSKIVGEWAGGSVGAEPRPGLWMWPGAGSLRGAPGYRRPRCGNDWPRPRGPTPRSAASSACRPRRPKPPSAPSCTDSRNPSSEHGGPPWPRPGSSPGPAAPFDAACAPDRSRAGGVADPGMRGVRAGPFDHRP